MNFSWAHEVGVIIKVKIYALLQFGEKVIYVVTREKLQSPFDRGAISCATMIPLISRNVTCKMTIRAHSQKSEHNSIGELLVEFLWKGCSLIF